MVVDAGVSQIPVGVDGEALVLDAWFVAPCSRPPAGQGGLGDRPGCPIPSSSWTGSGCGTHNWRWSRDQPAAADQRRSAGRGRGPPGRPWAPAV